MFGFDIGGSFDFNPNDLFASGYAESGSFETEPSPVMQPTAPAPVAVPQTAPNASPAQTGFSVKGNKQIMMIGAVALAFFVLKK